MVHIAAEEVVHGGAVKTLSLRDRAVLVCQKESLEINNFLSELGDSSRQSVVLCAEEFDLGLQISQPLLLALSTLERRDPT